MSAEDIRGRPSDTQITVEEIARVGSERGHGLASFRLVANGERVGTVMTREGAQTVIWEGAIAPEELQGSMVDTLATAAYDKPFSITDNSDRARTYALVQTVGDDGAIAAEFPCEREPGGKTIFSPASNLGPEQNYQQYSSLLPNDTARLGFMRVDVFGENAEQQQRLAFTVQPNAKKTDGTSVTFLTVQQSGLPWTEGVANWVLTHQANPNIQNHVAPKTLAATMNALSANRFRNK